MNFLFFPQVFSIACFLKHARPSKHKHVHTNTKKSLQWNNFVLWDKKFDEKLGNPLLCIKFFGDPDEFFLPNENFSTSYWDTPIQSSQKISHWTSRQHKKISETPKTPRKTRGARLNFSVLWKKKLKIIFGETPPTFNQNFYTRRVGNAGHLQKHLKFLEISKGLHH